MGVADTADTAVDVTVSRKPVAASKFDKQKTTLGHVKNNGRHNSTESNTSIGEGCPICNEPADGCKLKCDIFKQHIHDQCSGLESGTVMALLNIIDSTGRTCMNCRSDCEDHKSKVN